MPAGAEVTVPPPPPSRATVRVTRRANVAVTVVARITVRAHGPVPAQPPPLQPTKIEPASALAVRTTDVPAG
jgi:hypothetical protein